MTTEQTSTLVLKDHAGSYYLLSQEVLAQVRVPAEHTTEIEELLAAATRDGAGADDTEGYIPIWPIFVLPAVAAAGMHIGARISGSGSSGGGSAAWAYFESAYNQAKLQ